MKCEEQKTCIDCGYPGTGSSGLLADHTNKWIEVCDELEKQFPNADALLYVKGYVFGLRHAADMESRSPNGADSAKPQRTPLQSGAKSDAANDRADAQRGCVGSGDGLGLALRIGVSSVRG